MRLETIKLAITPTFSRVDGVLTNLAWFIPFLASRLKVWPNVEEYTPSASVSGINKNTEGLLQLIYQQCTREKRRSKLNQCGSTAHDLIFDALRSFRKNVKTIFFRSLWKTANLNILANEEFRIRKYPLAWRWDCRPTVAFTTDKHLWRSTTYHLKGL